MVPAVKNVRAHEETPSKPKFWARDLNPSSLLRNHQIFICIFAVFLQCSALFNEVQLSAYLTVNTAVSVTGD